MVAAFRSIFAILLACVLCLVASASALVAAPRAPLQQPLAARAAAPAMCAAAKGVVRIEIEVEQGEPCAPRPPA